MHLCLPILAGFLDVPCSPIPDPGETFRSLLAEKRLELRRLLSQSGAEVQLRSHRVLDDGRQRDVCHHQREQRHIRR